MQLEMAVYLELVSIAKLSALENEQEIESENDPTPATTSSKKG